MKNYSLLTRISSAALLLLLAGVAASEVKIAGQVAVAPYKLVRLKAEGADPKAGLLWRVTPAKGVDKAKTAEGELDFVAPPGQYDVQLIAARVNAAGKVEIEEAAVTVVIGDPPPPPLPPPPPVDSPLAKAFKAAYTQDAPNAAAVAAIAAIFRAAPVSLESRPDVRTTADLFAWLKGGMAATVPVKAVPKLEAAIAAELTAAFGAPSAAKPLDRTEAKAELTRIGIALGGL